MSIISLTNPTFESLILTEDVLYFKVDTQKWSLVLFNYWSQRILGIEMKEDCFEQDWGLYLPWTVSKSIFYSRNV